MWTPIGALTSSVVIGTPTSRNKRIIFHPNSQWISYLHLQTVSGRLEQVQRLQHHRQFLPSQRHKPRGKVKWQCYHLYLKDHLDSTSVGWDTSELCSHVKIVKWILESDCLFTTQQQCSEWRGISCFQNVCKSTYCLFLCRLGGLIKLYILVSTTTSYLSKNKAPKLICTVQTVHMPSLQIFNLTILYDSDVCLIWFDGWWSTWDSLRERIKCRFIYFWKFLLFLSSQRINGIVLIDLNLDWNELIPTVVWLCFDWDWMRSEVSRKKRNIFSGWVILWISLLCNFH